MMFLKKEIPLICHEFGHYLIACLIGKREFVQDIQFIGNIYGFYGQNRMAYLKYNQATNGEWECEQCLPTDKENLYMLFGGVVATEIVYNKKYRLSGTDKEKVYALCDSPKKRNEIRNKVRDILNPYKELLITLTNNGVKFLKGQEDEECVRITDVELTDWGVMGAINSLPELKL